MKRIAAWLITLVLCGLLLPVAASAMNNPYGEWQTITRKDGTQYKNRRCTWYCWKVAKERLGVATFASELRPAAFAKLARIALREKDWREAQRLSDRALAANALSLDALWSRAVALRKAGRTDDARRFAAATLSGLPLFHVLRYEAGKVGGKDDVRAFVRGEFPHETFMDMAAAYLEAGLNEEVRELLGFAGEHPL